MTQRRQTGGTDRRDKQTGRADGTSGRDRTAADMLVNGARMWEGETRLTAAWNDNMR